MRHDLLLEHAAHLSSRDAGLASQIVFGCLRYQAQLDYLIQHYSGRKLDAIEQPVILSCSVSESSNSAISIASLVMRPSTKPWKWRNSTGEQQQDL